MPDPSRLALFVGAALLLLVVPGPAVLYVVTQSIDRGRRAGLASVAGIHTGTLVHIAAATVGLSALLASSVLAFDVVKYAGAAYLILVGIRRLAGRERAGEQRAPSRSLYRQGIVVNVLNPKTALFFLAFLPQFIHPESGSVIGQFALLGIIFVALSICVTSALAISAGSVRGWLNRNRTIGRWQGKVIGSIYMALGVRLAFQQQ
jgi:threonine/homoserine/homoserine lactone efflux protein